MIYPILGRGIGPMVYYSEKPLLIASKKCERCDGTGFKNIGRMRIQCGQCSMTGKVITSIHTRGGSLTPLVS